MMLTKGQKLWRSKRERAIKKLLAIWEQPTPGEESDAVSNAIDAIVVAHIAAKLEWDSRPATNWQQVVDKSIERLVAAYEKLDGADNPEVEEELEIALDGLAVAHTAAALEAWSGPLKW